MANVGSMDLMTSPDMDAWVEAAARSAGYEHGFGVKGCDLSRSDWWAAYIRQSTEEQRQNNRVPEYLFTCAREAKRLDVIVPREYILYDAVTGEHLERPNMIHLRHELVPRRRIAGVIIPALDRLSREPVHIGIFEFELDHFRVSYHYADAPSGSDPISQMVRQNLAHAAKFVKLANRKNNRAGNIGRALKGIVPAFRPAYGYIYRADYQDVGGRRSVLRAWWELDSLDDRGEPIYGTPAWVVKEVFTWIGLEGGTLHRAAMRLNDMGIKTIEGSAWNSSNLQRIVRRRCYTGVHDYNVHTRVPNPNLRITDITAEIKRTRLETKPETEWVQFNVPALIDRDLWQKADHVLTERGRGRGKQGKSIQALLRGRMDCPRCEKPMVVRRAGKTHRPYYHCSAYHRPWAKTPCSYSRFVPGSWDEVVWSDVCAFLRNDRWVEEQLGSVSSPNENLAQLIRLKSFQTSQAEAKIERVRDGFENGIYTIEQARTRVTKLNGDISKLESEIDELRQRSAESPGASMNLEKLQEELLLIRDRNLSEATFDEKLEIISYLGIKVYPSEDLKSMHVFCQLNLLHDRHEDTELTPSNKENHLTGKSEPEVECGKVSIAPPHESKSRTVLASMGIFSGERGRMRRMVTWNFPSTTSCGAAIGLGRQPAC